MNNSFIHESSFIDENVQIGKNTKIWHFSHILSEVKIGENCSIGQNVVIGPRVIIGSGCKIQNNVSLYEGLVVEDEVFLGPSCVFTNVINPRAFVVRKEEFKKTVLEKGCSVGANATIVCGTKIGKYSMVGAGAVVTKDVNPYSVVIGNPAKHYKWVSRSGFILDESLKCPMTSEQYKEIDGNLFLEE